MSHAIRSAANAGLAGRATWTTECEKYLIRCTPQQSPISYEIPRFANGRLCHPVFNLSTDDALVAKGTIVRVRVSLGSCINYCVMKEESCKLIVLGIKSCTNALPDAKVRG
jgi:hypothetical protein